jgi:hypothetical protein
MDAVLLGSIVIAAVALLAALVLAARRRSAARGQGRRTARSDDPDRRDVP